MNLQKKHLKTHASVVKVNYKIRHKQWTFLIRKHLCNFIINEKMAEANGKSKNLHIAMYPWFAMGHLTPFLHLANKLSQKGNRISFFLPPKTQAKLAPLNHHPHLITFVPVPVPRVHGLPDGAETTNDVSPSAIPLLMTAMDLTRETIDIHLARLKPNIVFFDFTEWLPTLARKHRAKSVFYGTTPMFPWAYCNRWPRNSPPGYTFWDPDLIMGPPPGFPGPSVRLSAHEARALVYTLEMEFGEGMTLTKRLRIGVDECDAVGFKTCRELEGPILEFVEKQLAKPLLLAGPMIPTRPSSSLDEEIDGWLKGFGNHSVVYCALGSECALDKDQFHELVLGLEQTGKPFFAALRAPVSCETVECALPKGYVERTKERGMIYGGWVQQQQILRHPSVGCFVTHCGAGSVVEAMMSDCQIVLLPQAVDQFLNARMMSSYLGAGVEIEKRDSDGFFTRESISNAINLVMEEESDVGREVKANHAKWRQLLSREGLEDSYITQMLQFLHVLLEEPEVEAASPHVL